MGNQLAEGLRADVHHRHAIVNSPAVASWPTVPADSGEAGVLGQEGGPLSPGKLPEAEAGGGQIRPCGRPQNLSPLGALCHL